MTPASTAAASERPCVVHLVRAANGPEPFQRFLDSYRANDAGTAHDLVLLFKGFESESTTAPYRDRAAGLEAQTLFVDDRGYDLGAYLTAATRLRRPRYCFLNSFSVISAPGWLGILDEALNVRGVGLAGATGSWGSQQSFWRYVLRLPSPYQQVYTSRADTESRMRALNAERRGETVATLGLVRTKLRTARIVAGAMVAFEPFPAHHVRTNAFLITHEVLGRLRARRLESKEQVYRLESGRNSITRQIEAMGLRAVVSGRDGIAYNRDDWAASETFWQGRQANLLVADNQTEQYARGDTAVRDLLARFAWGRSAQPLPD